MGRIRNEILLKGIAKKLKKLREERGLSQEELYNDTSIHIGRIETGSVNVSVSTIDVLCRYFGISLSDFFSEIES